MQRLVRPPRTVPGLQQSSCAHEFASHAFHARIDDHVIDGVPAQPARMQGLEHRGGVHQFPASDVDHERVVGQRRQPIAIEQRRGTESSGRRDHHDVRLGESCLQVGDPDTGGEGTLAGLLVGIDPDDPGSEGGQQPGDVQPDPAETDDARRTSRDLNAP
jgi:hypothetical protein